MAVLNTVREPALRIAVSDLSSILDTLETELSGGRSIELVRGETVIAEMRAKRAVTASVTKRDLPDFMGRMKAIWGDRVFPEGYMTQAIREDRDARG